MRSLSYCVSNFLFVECTALYTYSGESGDLSFQEGDVISITKSDGDWWEGTLNGRKGIFPANYVKMKEAEVKHYNDCQYYLNSLSSHKSIITDSMPNLVSSIWILTALIVILVIYILSFTGSKVCNKTTRYKHFLDVL